VSALLGVVLWGAPASADLANRIKLSKPRFGTVEVGTTERARIYVTNEGDQPFQVNGASMTTPEGGFEFGFAKSTCFFIVLEPGESCYVVIRFSPTAEGTYTAEFDINGYFIDPIDSTCCLSKPVKFKAVAA
jgi:Abnormal spindle-like microcephaly-assoc'd, ASPM-SPD-2-Hydin